MKAHNQYLEEARNLLKESTERIIRQNPAHAEHAKKLQGEQPHEGLVHAMREIVPGAGLEAAGGTDDSALAFETIVNREGRPVLLVKNDRVVTEGVTDPVWKPVLTAASFASTIGPCLLSVGRVEVAGNPRFSWLGTGWLLDEDIIVTNRHVAAEFGRLGSDNKFTFRRSPLDPAAKMSASLDFKEEFGADEAAEFNVIDILHIEDDDGPDLAFLKLAPNSNSGLRRGRPLRLAEGRAEEDILVCTVGYPASDSRVPDQELVRRIFGEVYDVKRFAPGQILKDQDDLLTHSCSTLGGNSGSPVLDLRTGEAVALHFSGLFLRENRAVPARLVKERLDAIRRPRVFPGPGREIANKPALQPTPASITPQSVSIADQDGGGDDGVNTVTFNLQVPVTLSLKLQQPTVIPSAVRSSTDDKLRPSGRITGAVEAVRRQVAGDRRILAVRHGYVFREGWVTQEPAVAVVLRDSSARESLNLPAAIDGVPIEIRDPGLVDLIGDREAVGVEEGVPETSYKKPEGLTLKTVTGRMRVTCHTSPDAGWPTLADFLGRTKHSLTIGMYDFTAPHILRGVKEAVQSRPRKLRLVLDPGESLSKTGIKKDDVSESVVVETLEKALGNRFDHVPASTGKGHQFASAYHIKVAVRDGEAFWLSSGNWQSSNQNADTPEAGSKEWRPLLNLNREWHAVIENPALANTFEKYLEYDFEQAQADAGTEAIIPPELLFEIEAEALEAREPEGDPEYFQPLELNREVTVTPLLTPDNYADEVLKLLKSARREIFFQNQSLNLIVDRDGEPADDPRFGALVDTLLKKQERGLEVRIIMRGEFNPQTQLERLQARGFDMSKIRLQDHCHTKGIIIDGKRVLLGSHNWTNQGTLVNRDASLIFEDEEVAKHFRKIFLFDWKKLTRASVGRPRRVRPVDNEQRESPVPSNVVRLSLAELLEG